MLKKSVSPLTIVIVRYINVKTLYHLSSVLTVVKCYVLNISSKHTIFTDISTGQFLRYSSLFVAA